RKAAAGTSEETCLSGAEGRRVPAGQTILVIHHAVFVVTDTQDQREILRGLPVVFEENVPIIFMLGAFEEYSLRIVRPALLRWTVDIELFLQAVDRPSEIR